MQTGQFLYSFDLISVTLFSSGGQEGCQDLQIAFWAFWAFWAFYLLY